jgi:hypothetical protein
LAWALQPSDLGALSKAAPKDDSGRDRALFIKDAETIVMGTSQSGPFVQLQHLRSNWSRRGREKTGRTQCRLQFG